MPKIGLYIHFPFCLRKCPYCDFYSVCQKPDEEKLLAGYIRDLDLYPHATLTSIFIGGGTPSLMSQYLLSKLFAEIKKRFKLAK
ncbi:MAG: hypothetical protein LBR35_00910, partial [Rickettsiales bacterium]|nr:hypothetical protein [Rickettsiales bacterium]